ncbi:MAG: hypothetical protein R3302_07870 [Sulfurimonadaceae bacterium]|nr:hypothetical protein [Sulfurimonadaceae bacterium]
MSESYRDRGRLSDGAGRVERFRPILDKDRFQSEEPHWRRISKNTISLFQVLIDQDLKDLVAVLEQYPRYIEWVCEHFRYAYSYSENEADIAAASRLLQLGEPYFSKQFVRNVVRKLPKIDSMDLETLANFARFMGKHHLSWHPIVTNHYCDALNECIDAMKLHPLQRIAVIREIDTIERQETYDYEAEDRDAVLDIPYMT